jgi:hypothetical protein
MFFRNALIDYLNDNSTLFPLYKPDCDSDCDNLGSNKSYPSGIYLG